MFVKELTPKLALNKAFLKIKPNRTEIEIFKSNLITLLDKLKTVEDRPKDESEEHLKNDIRDFLRDTFYKDTNAINTKDKKDLVIHTSKDTNSKVGVIIEAKRPSNKGEMLSKDNLNKKALQELVLYYLRERITHKNLEVKHLIITNINEWYIFDEHLFERLFIKKELVKQFESFEHGKKSTSIFYKEIAEPFIQSITNEIEYTYFNLKDYESALRNQDKKDDKQLIELFKLLSPPHLLKLPFNNDSNSLDKNFYAELLHIIGLVEVKDGGKKLIQRPEDEKKRNPGSLLENTINQLDSLDKLSRLTNLKQYGETQEERLFNVGLELCITWVNRILFLKLLEAQLISYHKGDKSYSFLNQNLIHDYDNLNSLFFMVLARKPEDRNQRVKDLFSKVPYLNSSLFEPTILEHEALFISGLEDNIHLPFLNSTVNKDNHGNKEKGSREGLAYLFDFLSSYNFTSDSTVDIQEDNKTLINASVLGLIFEKINGYKDGSFFTPGFITEYMCRETIRRSVVQKFNEIKSWNCSDFNDLYNKIDNIQEANKIVNDIKICDPAVGSGHFLVSALNEMLSVKNDLNILHDKDGKRLKGYHVEVINDELVVTDEDGDLFEYNPLNKERQRIQETLFHEKQTIIENCLFGVDINPNSVKICRLRLWIELLKNAYYTAENVLETLPNIDINIKCGNSLVSRFDVNTDMKEVMKKSKWSIDAYKKAVDTYRNAESKDQKREMEQLINDIKNDFRTEIGQNSKEQRDLIKFGEELYQKYNAPKLFEETLSNTLKKKQEKEKKELENKVANLKKTIEEIKSNKIYENAFEWRFEFPEVLNDEGDFEGFDIILGNPPYIAVSGISQKEREFIFAKFPNASSRIDLFGIFTEFGTQIMKVNGLLTFIIPMQLLKNTAFSSIRKNLLSNSSIHKINYVGSSIFEDANNDTIVIEYENISPSDDFEIEISVSTSNELGLTTKAKYNTKQSLFLKDDFSITLSSASELVICDKLEKNSNELISENFNIIQGIVTGLNGAYIFDGEILSSIEKENLNPFLLGSDFKEYSINKGTCKQILYLDKNVHLEDFPNTKIWLEQFKEKLEKRREVLKGVIPWYSLQWPRDKNSFELPKIIFQKIRNQSLKQRLVGTFDNQCYFVGDGVIYLTSKKKNCDDELKYLLGLLNSEIYNFYYRQKYLDVNLKIMFLEKTPIITLKAKKQIIYLVDKILDENGSVKESSLKTIKKQIDQIIYDELGLSDDEIKIILGE